MKYRTVVPNNEKYWQVFEGDKQIEEFLQFRNEFELPNSDSKYDKNCLHEEQCDQKEPPPIAEIDLLTSEFENQTEEYINSEKEDIEVLQSKDKGLPKGLAPLEDLFDFNDVAKKPTIEPTYFDIEECNIGSKDKPKTIKLSKILLAHIKLKYIELFKEFSDFFSWSYEDLNTYDTETIQHKIPPKEN